MTDLKKTELSEREIERAKFSRNFKSLLIASSVSGLISSIIGVFYILTERFSLLSIPGQFIQNFTLSFFLMYLLYLIIARKKLHLIDTPIDQAIASGLFKNKDRGYDSLDPGYGVNNPASPFCHNLSRLNEHHRRDY